MKTNGVQQAGQQRARGNGAQSTAERPTKIESEELLVVSQSKPDQKGRFQKLRVVRWSRNGEKGGAKLEKRGFFPGTKSGDILNGDLQSLNLEDVQRLAEQMPTVIEVMQEGQFGA